MIPKHPKITHASQLSELSSWRKYKRELLELEFTHSGSSLIKSQNDLVKKSVKESFLAYAFSNPVSTPGGSHGSRVDFNFLEILGSHFEDIAEGRYPILLVSMPPRTGKSTLGALFLSWLLGKDPTTENIVTSYDQRIAKLTVDRVKGIVDTSSFGEMFSKFDLKRYHVVPSAPESSVCGFSYGGLGKMPGVWLIDDCHKNPGSEVDGEWLEQIGIRHHQNSATVVLGTRLGEKDIFNYFLEKFGVFDPVSNPKGAVHINLSAIIESREEAQSDILGRQIKEQLDMFRPEALSAFRRDLGETKFSWFYKGCAPTPVESGFKLCEEVPPLDKVIISVDPAFSAYSTDKTGICIAGVTKQRDCMYVLEAYEGNWDLKTVGLILSLAAKAYGAEKIVLEPGTIAPVWAVYLQGLGLDVCVGGQSRQAKSSAIIQMRDSGKVYFSNFDPLSLERECDNLGLADILCAVLVSYIQLLPVVA
jgi:hypothetical protein